MIGQLILIGIIALVISVIEMTPKIKQIAYIILGIAALLVILPLVGISVPLN